MNPSPAPALYGAPITLDEARRMAAAAEAEAKKYDWMAVIAIVDSSGHLVLLQRMDNAQYGSIAVAQGKAETAVYFKRSTKVFQDLIANGGVGLRSLAMPGVLPVEGGLLIVRDGKIIGAIGVSGMRAEEDAMVATAGLAAIGATESL